MRARSFVLPVLSLAGTAASLAHSSAIDLIEQGTFSIGGNPGPALSFANHQVTLDAIGDGLARMGSISPSFSTESGFFPGYRLPGEVLNVHFTAKTQFAWNLDPCVGKYDTCRGSLGNFAGTGTSLHGGHGHRRLRSIGGHEIFLPGHGEETPGREGRQVYGRPGY